MSLRMCANIQVGTKQWKVMKWNTGCAGDATMNSSSNFTTFKSSFRPRKKASMAEMDSPHGSIWVRSYILPNRLIPSHPWEVWAKGLSKPVDSQTIGWWPENGRKQKLRSARTRTDSASKQLRLAHPVLGQLLTWKEVSAKWVWKRMKIVPNSYFLLTDN